MDHTPDRRDDRLTQPGTRAADVHDAAHDAARTADAAAASGTVDVDRTGDLPGGPGLGGTNTKAGNTAVGVGAGMVAGTMAGLQAGALAGAATLGVGGLAGAMLGAAAGAALAQDADPTRYTPEVDAHYRALYERAPATDRAYDHVRPAYVFGHVAAAEPDLAGMTFDEAEPALRAAWNDELRARAGTWEQARRHVLDAYGHARSEGAGERRDLGVIGSAGSAVDPVELDRAQHGLPSVPDGTTTPSTATPSTAMPGTASSTGADVDRPRF
jgi:hypothetical protein